MTLICFLSHTKLGTVNDQINARFQINASYVVNTQSTLKKLY